MLAQWTLETIRDEDEHGSHGVEVWNAASSSRRLLELDPGDVMIVAAVTDGTLLPICRLVVERVATREELKAEGHDPYPLPFHAIGQEPLPRMNLRYQASRQLSLGVRRASGGPLARRRDNPRRLDGQAFRIPQWIDERSAAALTNFLDRVWEDEDSTGLNDPVRVARGFAPRITAAERKAIEDRAMKVVASAYSALGYAIDDVSDNSPWDLTATHPDGDEAHIEVKGTTGSGAAVVVTAGERRHAEEYAHPVLTIVTDIQLAKGPSPRATKGKLGVHLDPWNTDDGFWAETVWRYEPPQ
ncbi:hypothetical protein AYO39_00430 [Actinobacteria bacterium SCGC AG-212-D09]|nr:hypothetical protein AYO39_00430 [Actinobacteria bacterium SCGC AG-212-D09]